jgi:hypothetical protein
MHPNARMARTPRSRNCDVRRAPAVAPDDPPEKTGGVMTHYGAVAACEHGGEVGSIVGLDGPNGIDAAI